MKSIFYFIVSFTFFIASCSSKKNINEEQVQIAKDYVFCKCYYSQLDSITLKNVYSIDLSLGYYFDVYEGNPFYLDSIAKDYAFKIEKTQILDLGNRIPLMADCLKFYRSKKLDSLIRNRPY